MQRECGQWANGVEMVGGVNLEYIYNRERSFQELMGMFANKAETLHVDLTGIHPEINPLPAWLEGRISQNLTEGARCGESPEKGSVYPKGDISTGPATPAIPLQDDHSFGLNVNGP